MNLIFKGLLAFVLALQINASAFELNKDELVRNLEFVRNIFGQAYAPTAWKSRHSNWDLNAVVDEAVNEVRTTENLSLKQYQRILKRVIDSTQDYHVSIRFFSTETARLHFEVRGVGEKVFIVYVNREKLPASVFPFQVGDELVEFDGLPVKEAIERVRQEGMLSTPGTDQMLAQMMLTWRRGARGQDVPQGAIMVKVRPQGSEFVQGRQLLWDYTPEMIQPGNVVNSGSMIGLTGSQHGSSFNPQMAVMDFVNTEKNLEVNPFQIGGKKTFVPRLGKVIWQADASKFFDAYIYQDAKKRLIGYVRIASYGAGEDQAEEFMELMQKMQETTEALVIDQVNNPGGSVFYLYALVSMLTDQPIYTPKHRMFISQEEVQGALQTLPELEKVQNDADAIKKFGKTFAGTGYPTSYTFIQFFKNYLEFVKSEWGAGRKLSRPYHIAGVDQINPHPQVRYTKPVVILVNELDFSGGDFFPAILQDAKRAKILGTRTAGAGGYVLNVAYPNLFGMESFSYTGSLAERVDLNPIENLGVTPDIEYQLTEQDYRGGFQAYKAKILEVIEEQL